MMLWKCCIQKKKKKDLLPTFWLDCVSFSFDAQCLAEGLGTLKVFRKFLLMDWLNEWMNEWDFLGEIFWVRFSIRRGKRSWEKILSRSQALFPLSKLRNNKAFHLMISENVHLILMITCEKYWEVFVIHTFRWGNWGPGRLKACSRPHSCWEAGSSPPGISWSRLPYSRSRCPVGLS